MLLWGHAAVIPVYALIRGYSIPHTIAESIVLPTMALLATHAPHRRLQSLAASVGLLSSSGLLVHLSGGLIEMHFHFFVMVAVVALYQDWLPFLTSIGYVLVHHGLMGSLDPHLVFNHPAAIASPWKWGAIHAFFIFGISVACLVNWRLNETAMNERRRAEDRLREESRVVETLHGVGKLLAAELDLRTVVQRVTDAATQLTNAAFGAFFYNVTRADGESYMLYTISGADPEAFAKFPMPRNTPIFEPTFAGRETVRLDDVTQDPRYGRVAPHHGMPPGHLPVRSYLAVPVRSRTGGVIGGLFFGHPEVGRFGELEERVATGIASHAAIAIDNANLYESEKRARASAEETQRRMAIMAEASQAVSSSLDLERSLQDLADVIAPAIGDSCEVYLVEGGEISLVAHRRAGAAEPPRTSYKPDPQNMADPVARAVAMHATQFVPVFSDEDVARAITDPAARAIAARLKPTSAIVVPLLRRDEICGVLTVGTNADSARRLDLDDVPLVEELGRRAAIAIENARLFSTQRTAAHTLQHSLLPDKLPDLPGVSLAARYVPGGPGVEVGGDWYDVIVLRDGSLGLAMGDVVGRGVTAAALMGQFRNALRAYALEGTPPAEMLARLNELLEELEVVDNSMATLVYAVFDLETGTLRIANAGHPPPLVRDVEGRTTFLEGTTGPPIGALPGARYTETLTTLEPGATLLLYTDGLVEDRYTSLDRGLETLRGLVESSPDDLDQLCDGVLERSPVAGGSDDVALLAMRCSPIHRRLELSLPTKPSILRPMRAALRRWLRAAGATEDEAFEILVASGEACANVIQHAGTQNSRFELCAELDGKLVITVTDHGRWRPQRRTLGGRGLGVMETFMDETSIDRSAQGTTVVMRRALNAGHVEVDR